MSRLHMGIDVGSTTVKVVVLDENKNTLFAEYRRHFSDIKSTVKGLFAEVKEVVKNEQFTVVITGSGGLLLSKMLDLPFVQEVIANKTAKKTFMPETDVVIELGGEDAKILYLSGGLEQRMNGTCAGGTGSFIDQMASLLQTDASGLNEYAKNYKALYSIAARCGVFAKSDIQPLINDGATHEDLAASIFQAVVNQTISGLTTAAGVWATAGIGMTIGAGLYFLGVAATLLIVAAQMTLHKNFTWLNFPVAEQISMEIEDTGDGVASIRDKLLSHNLEIISMKSRNNGNGLISLDLYVKLPRNYNVTQLMSLLSDNPHIKSIDL